MNSSNRNFYVTEKFNFHKFKPFKYIHPCLINMDHHLLFQPES